MSGKQKLYFLLNRIDDVRAISRSGQTLKLDPIYNLRNNFRKDELANLFVKLDLEEKVIKLIKAPQREKGELEELDPYDFTDDGCWYIELLPKFDRYFLEIQQEPDYEEYSGRKSTQKRAEQQIHDLSLLHPVIFEKCRELFKSGTYAECVEKGFKVVRDKLRRLTGYETGSNAFGNVPLHIKGAAAENVDEDFNKGVQFLTMAIDRFRNEKTHTSDAKIDNPQRAYEYLALSSLAMNLLDQAEIVTK